MALQPYSLAATAIVLMVGPLLAYIVGQSGNFKTLIILMSASSLVFYTLLMTLHSTFSPGIFGMNLIVQTLSTLLLVALG